MISAERICKSYVLKGGRRPVLRDLSFDLPKGKNLAILGGAGSGKSTLLKIIGGLDHPDRGRLRRYGSVSWPFGQMRYERGMTVIQNLRFLCRVLGERDFERVEREVTELTGFDRQFNQTVSMLRGQETRRLSDALSLAFSFDILLLDGRPRFGNLPNNEAYEAKFVEKMSQSAIILATDAPKDIDKTFSYFLVLDGEAGQLYENRKKAVEAFRKINNIAPPQGREGRKDDRVEEEQGEGWGYS